MTDWERLTLEEIKPCPPMYRNHYGDHDIGYQDPLGNPPQAFTWVRLNDPELDALATKSEKVQALVEAAKQIGCYRFHKPGQPEWEALQSALAPFEAADA